VAKAIVWFDCDGVLTNHPSSWAALHEYFGSRDNRFFAELYRKGYISYLDWMKIDIALMIHSYGKPITRSDVEKALSIIRVKDSAVEVFNTLRKNYVLGVISSGVDVVVKRVCEALKPDICLYNELVFVDGILIPGGRDNVPLLEKPRIIREVSEEYGFTLDRVVYVGDSVWDAVVFKSVGLSIAVEPCGEACSYATYVVRDLREIPVILEKHYTS